MTSTGLPSLLQTFFGDRMIRERSASAHTVAAYRDSFRLLLRFASERLKKAPSDLDVKDLEAPFVSQFLEHLEKGRGNGARTRRSRGRGG